MEGTSGEGLLPIGHSSQGLHQRGLPVPLLSVPVPRKEAAGLVPVGGGSVCRDLGRPLRSFFPYEEFLDCLVCGAEARLTPQAEVIEMNGCAQLAPTHPAPLQGPHWDMQGSRHHIPPLPPKKGLGCI